MRYNRSPYFSRYNALGSDTSTYMMPHIETVVPAPKQQGSVTNKPATDANYGLPSYQSVVQFTTGNKTFVSPTTPTPNPALYLSPTPTPVESNSGLIWLLVAVGGYLYYEKYMK